MIRSLVIVLVLATPILADRDEASLQRMADSLQGTWTVQRMEVAGETVDAARLRSMRFTFDHGVLIDENKPEDAVRLNLDVSGNIAKVEMLDRYGDTREGLIQSGGNSIVMCYIKTDYKTPRRTPPTELRSTPENGATLMQFKPLTK